MWSRSTVGAEQAQCRARLGGQCAACTNRLDQGSAVAGLGCAGGGDTGSGLQWGRRHCWDRARATRTRLRDRVRAGHGTARLGTNTRAAAGAEPVHGKGAVW